MKHGPCKEISEGTWEWLGRWSSRCVLWIALWLDFSGRLHHGAAQAYPSENAFGTRIGQNLCIQFNVSASGRGPCGAQIFRPTSELIENAGCPSW
jgi:hypothetical protein